MDKITAGLERDGILTGAREKKWHTSTINKILRNEKYIGDALLQKTYITDFLNKTRVKNNGLVPSILCRRRSRSHYSERHLPAGTRKNWSAGEWVKPAPTVRNGTTVTITASPKSSSAENAAKCSEGSTGTTEASNQLSGAASAG